ncbi:MAG: hypothetical protein ACRD9Q_01170 [Nitrososphaeraceae archaeon]
MKQFLVFIMIFVLASGMYVGEAMAASVNAVTASVSGWKMILFKGDGMHRHHNVEITISNNEGFVVKLLTKTTDRGIFYMPWIIPKSLEKGSYNVVATDKINTVTTIFKI